MRSMHDQIKNIIDESIAVKKLIPISSIEEVASLFIKTLQSKKKLMVAGNGGSAADAQHIAAEFTGRFLRERKPLPAMALSTNTSSITAIGNDYGYEHVFSRQVEAFGLPDDVFIAISTSGNSVNLIEAVNSAKKKRVKTVGVTGRDGGELGKAVDYHLNINHLSTPRVQEAHILSLHIVCELVEEALFTHET